MGLSQKCDAVFFKVEETEHVKQEVLKLGIKAVQIRDIVEKIVVVVHENDEKYKDLFEKKFGLTAM